MKYIKIYLTCVRTAFSCAAAYRLDFILGNLHNFGDRNSLHGSIKALADNGVSVEQKEIWSLIGEAESIIELDFTEHDKVFEDKIAKLESEISYLRNTVTQYKEDCVKLEKELESRETVELPFDPLDTANYLINATYVRETNGFERTFHNLPEKVNSDRYTVDDLEQIAEHLLVYCKHNKELE